MEFCQKLTALEKLLRALDEKLTEYFQIVMEFYPKLATVPTNLLLRQNIWLNFSNSLNSTNSYKALRAYI